MILIYDINNKLFSQINCFLLNLDDATISQNRTMCMGLKMNSNGKT